MLYKGKHNSDLLRQLVNFPVVVNAPFHSRWWQGHFPWAYVAVIHVGFLLTR